jgi:hypothetical protein
MADGPDLVRKHIPQYVHVLSRLRSGKLMGPCDLLGFQQAESFHPFFGPILMTFFAALSNTLLLTSEWSDASTAIIY